MAGLERGLVQVYTGNGKGKTTAAFGLVLRAAGWGLRSFVAQFMKQQPSGESEALKCLSTYVTVEQFGRAGFVRPGRPTPEDIDLAHRGLEQARRALLGGEYDLIVLDEVLTAVSFGLLGEDEVLALIAERPPRVELVLTGHNATPAIVAQADLVTRTVAEKHPYERGVAARRGIEY